MAIVFGSPEAQAILARDKEVKRLAEEEAQRNSEDGLAARESEILSEIEDFQSQIASLNYELEEIQEKRRKKK